MSGKLTYLDLFAGAGGLSEGFIREGFEPLAHVESDSAACFTLRTRAAFHWLKKNGREDAYYNYIEGNISRDKLYGMIPENQIHSVINKEICKESMPGIFKNIDELLDGKNVSIIIGGPPCQAYSIVGRARSGERIKGDKRNYLYTYYAEFLKHYKPLYFVFENVLGLLSAKNEKGESYFDGMRRLFHEVGYETEKMILSAEEYGVLQKRRRIILTGKRKDLKQFCSPPEKIKYNVAAGEIFLDLPHITAGKGQVRPISLLKYEGEYLRKAGIRTDAQKITWHQARPNTEQDLEIYRLAVNLWDREKKRLKYETLPDQLKTHKNQRSFLDRFKVVAADLPYSHTVVAHISKDGHYYIHPDISQNRSLTPREAARLQTFPDDYYFESASGIPGRTPAFRQIGNAVPVLMAAGIARKVKEIL